MTPAEGVPFVRQEERRGSLQEVLPIDLDLHRIYGQVEDLFTQRLGFTELVRQAHALYEWYGSPTVSRRNGALRPLQGPCATSAPEQADTVLGFPSTG